MSSFPNSKFAPLLGSALLMFLRIIVIAATLAGILPPFAAFSAESCDQAKIARLVTPSPPPTEFQSKRYRAIASEIRADIDSIIIGDSLIQLWPYELAQSALGAKRLLNYGIGSDRIQEVLWRLKDPKLADIRPKDVVLLIGTNNLGMGDETCAIVAGMEAVVHRVRGLWPKARLIIIEILPRGNNSLFRQDDRVAINVALSHFSLRMAKTSSVNMDDALKCNSNGHCPSYDETYIHLTQSGYEILSRMIEHHVTRH